jgi:hypothetical protein
MENRLAVWALVLSQSSAAETRRSKLHAMSCVKSIVGWIGPIVAACLILAPIVRFCQQAETPVSQKRLEPNRAADTSNATLRVAGGLVRWCELPGCKAGETRAAVVPQPARFADPWVPGPVTAASSSASPLRSESTSLARPAVAIRWHSKPPALPIRLQI